MWLKSFFSWGDRLDARVMGASWRDVQKVDAPILAEWRRTHPLAKRTGLLGAGDRLDHWVGFKRGSGTVIQPLGREFFKAAVFSWRLVLVIAICIVVGVFIPAPFGGFVSTGVVAFYLNRVWWTLHNHRREQMRAEIASHR